MITTQARVVCVCNIMIVAQYKARGRTVMIREEIVNKNAVVLPYAIIYYFHIGVHEILQWRDG